MRIVIAPDSFKGSLDATSVAAALATGWREVRPADQIVVRPMADGGEGTMAAFEAAVPESRRIPVQVAGPIGERVETHWLLLPPDAAGRTVALVELASCCGMELLGKHRDPWRAGTAGIGMAISAALDHGVDVIRVGIGSSASVDGGLGLLQALGAHLADADGAPIAPGANGLLTLAAADLVDLRQFPAGGLVVLADVTNPLLGPDGAAAVFGPQKGLAAKDVPRIDVALARAADLLGYDVAAPGSGAAGGVGAALLRCGATLVPGAVAIADACDLSGVLTAADLVITGEGSFDGQSARGKAPFEVADRAIRNGVRVALVAGRVDPSAETAAFDHITSLSELAGSVAAALADPEAHLRSAGRRLAAAQRGR